MDLDNLVRAKLPNFGYQMFFASDDAPALLQPNVRHTLHRLEQAVINIYSDTAKIIPGFHVCSSRKCSISRFCSYICR